MTHLSIPFLQRVTTDAPQNGYTVLDVHSKKGLVLLPADSSAKEQIDALNELISQLQATILEPEQPPPAYAPTDCSCQVTVEERAQLFKFLQS